MNITADPSTRLLLQCVQSEFADGDHELPFIHPEETTDWPAMLAGAQRHRILPTVFRALGRTDRARMPEETAAIWAAQMKKAAVRNLTLTSALFRVMDRFHEAGMTIIPYKGPALAAMAWPEPDLRTFRDLDLMVRPADARGALALLKRLDFEPINPMTTFQERALHRYGYDCEMVRPADGTLLELHWAAAQPYFSFPFDLEKAFSRLTAIRVKGRSVPTFSPEDTLLLLCAHGVKHMWKRLQWVADIAGLLRHAGEMDWNYVLAEALRTGSCRMLYLGLALAEDLIGATLPEGIKEAVRRDQPLPVLIQRTRHRLFSESYDDPPFGEQARYHLKARERGLDRVKYLYRSALMPTPEDCTAFSLPSPMLYYVTRPIRLLQRSFGGKE